MPRILCGLAAGALLAITGAQSVVAAQGKKPNPRSMAVISVEFTDDCSAAIVESDKDIGNIAVVLKNLSWQKIENLPPNPTYTIAADPDGPNAGQPILMLYVKAGSYRQKDLVSDIPGHVGVPFACEPAG
jgi:hypothetical protein